MGAGSSLDTEVAEIKILRNGANRKWSSKVKSTRNVVHVRPTTGADQTYDNVSPEIIEKVTDIWRKVEKSCFEIYDYPCIQHLRRNTKSNSKRMGWKVVRIFVSSTFLDFYKEREVLIKEVFPKLQQFCETRRLHLVECDLRWGIPKDSTTEYTLRTCMHEIDRCYEDNELPFFINLTSQRIGWIPQNDQVPSDIREGYDWIEGLSVTEMEIVHGAYRVNNPNAIITLRNPQFIKDIPPEFENTKKYVDSKELQNHKLVQLKKKLHKRFLEHQVSVYSVTVEGMESENRLSLSGYDDFKTTVFEFFKTRIDHQYPLDDTPVDKYEEQRQLQESFMMQRSEFVDGREKIIGKIENFISTKDSILLDGKPMFILGESGIGKTSIVAAATRRIISNGIQVESKQPMVFYQFIGSSPGSTDMDSMLNRLLKQIMSYLGRDVGQVASVQNELNAILANKSMPPMVIVVDSVNQFTHFSLDNDDVEIFSWLPFQIAPQIRVVMSMITNTDCHKSLIRRFTKTHDVIVKTLDNDVKVKIVQKIFDNYGKKLDVEQLEALAAKKLSDNPLWLIIACDELRVHGNFLTILTKINALPDQLVELQVQVIRRVKMESEFSDLIEAAICLLEISAQGLLENEMRLLLSEDNNNQMLPKADVVINYSSSLFTDECQPLPAAIWSDIFREVKPFTRPLGGGEGRLNFYHSSFSRAVLETFFDEKDFKSQRSKFLHNFWHKRIADFFLNSKTVTFNRQLEELPVHLLAFPGGKEKLVIFLSSWKVLEALFDTLHSSKLIALWRSCSTVEVMIETYEALLAKESVPQAKTTERLTEIADRYFKVFQDAFHNSTTDNQMIFRPHEYTSEAGAKTWRIS